MSHTACLGHHPSRFEEDPVSQIHTAVPSTATLHVDCSNISVNKQSEEPDSPIYPPDNCGKDYRWVPQSTSPYSATLSSPTARNTASGSIAEENKGQESAIDKFRRTGHVIHRVYNQCSYSLLLENTASVARDHLANERTFLAWLRTSLSLITAGVAITQLYHLAPANTSGIDKRIGRALGSSFVLFSIIFLYFGNARYFHAQHAMTKGYFPASRGIVLFASTSVLGMLVTMLVALVLEHL